MAECFGIVYVEASAMGLPSLARDSGGVTDAVRSGVNGEVFAHDAPASAYADHVETLFKDTVRYEALCVSAHQEHLDRLNWRATGQALRGIFEEVVRR
jgi:glycosyltransferase involved in cell wall biosynthesis